MLSEINRITKFEHFAVTKFISLHQVYRRSALCQKIFSFKTWKVMTSKSHQNIKGKFNVVNDHGANFLQNIN